MFLILELLKIFGGGLITSVLLSMLIGVGIGLGLALLAYGLLKLARLIRPETPRVASVGVGLWFLILLPLLFGARGFHSGLNKSVKKMLSESELVNTLTPNVGGHIADFAMQLDARLAELDGGSVQAGRLETKVFTERCQRQAQKVIDDLIPEIVADMKAGAPVIADGAGEVIFDWFVNLFGEEILKSAARAEFDRFGLVGNWFGGLVQASEAAGFVMSRGQLADYSAGVIADGITRPLDVIGRIQRRVSALVALAIMVLPAVGLWYLHRRQRREVSAHASA